MLNKIIFAKELTTKSPDFVGFFMVQGCVARKAKNDSQYLNLTLRDRTGDVDAKVWNWDGTFTPAIGMILKLEAECGEYKDAVQLKVLRMREASDDEVVLDDFLPASKYDRDALRDDVLHTAKLCIHDDIIKTLVLNIIEKPEVWKLLRDAPAAKGNHQPYLGGLLEHIDNLIELVQGVSCAQRGGALLYDLDADLLIAAAIIHDIGKVYELNFSRSVDYSRRGKLVGHVVIGLQMFHEARAAMRSSGDLLEPGTNPPVMLTLAQIEKLDALEHIICSHHGRKEWGAPQTPMSREAVLFHLLDMIDSRMGGFDEIAKESVDALGFSSWMKQNDGPIWRPVHNEETSPEEVTT